MSILKKLKISDSEENIFSFIKSSAKKFIAESSIIREKLKDLPKTNYELGLRHFERGNLDDAIMRFKMVSFLLPEHKESNYQLGRCLVIKEDNERAKECFERAVEIDPDYSEAKYMLKKITDPSSIKRIPDIIIEENLRPALPFTDYKSSPTYEKGRLITSKVLPFIIDKNPNLSILDLECGSGVGSICLKFEKEIVKKIEGITVSKELAGKLSEAKQKDARIFEDCIVASYDNHLGSNKSSYDMIIIETAFKWVGDLTSFIPLIGGALKKGGLCVAVIPFADINKSQGYRLDIKHDNFEYSKSYVDFQIESAGLNILDKGNKKDSKEGKEIYLFQKV